MIQSTLIALMNMWFTDLLLYLDSYQYIGRRYILITSPRLRVTFIGPTDREYKTNEIIYHQENC